VLPRSQAPTYLPTLATHLNVLASASPPHLPKDTLAFLRPFLVSPATLEDVLRTARALHDLSENCTLGGTSAAAAASAILLLALEAHAHPPRSAPHALVLAAQLGAAVGARGAAVMVHYRAFVDIIEAGAARVPWLVGANTTGGKRLSRRSRVARAVLDVLQFRDEFEQAAVDDRGGPIRVEIEAENDAGEEDKGNEGDDESVLDALILQVELKSTENMRVDTRAAAGVVASSIRKPRKPRTAASQAACFLLDPLAYNAPARTALTHTTYLLSSDACPGSTVPPTRLQLLTAERGNAEAIQDDELFDDDELEGIVVGTDEQAREEREMRARTLQMIWGDEEEDDAARANTSGGDGGKSRRKRGKERVDINKLATLLESDDAFTALGLELSPGEEEVEQEEAAWIECEGTGSEEVVSEWRPVSPGGCEVEWE
jgi:transcription factor IIIB 90 kDa subunit